MARLRIETRRQFADALTAVPYAATRLSYPIDPDEPLADYGLWSALCGLVNSAIEESDWAALGSLLALYDGVERAGPRGEMVVASYVAFLEDVHLPKDPAALREFWRHSPPGFVAAIEADRGLRKTVSDRHRPSHRRSRRRPTR
jgi:hypothetical protein